MTDIVWWEGGLVPASEACLPVASRGVQHGLGCYETLRAYNARVFRLAAHLARLESSAAALSLAAPAADLVERAIAATIEANHLTEAAVRVSLFATRAVGAPPLGVREGSAGPAQSSESCALHIAAMPAADWTTMREVGTVAITSSGVRRDPRSPLSGVKITGAPASLLARAEAARAGADEALLLTVTGLLSEFSAANIFVVARGALLTPSLASGCLGGVTRTVVLDAARELGMVVEEGEYASAIFDDATECFMTGSVREVVPIVRIDGREIGRGVRGPITCELQIAYAARVAEETVVAPRRSSAP